MSIIYRTLTSVVNFFVFSSLYIALCAVLMVYQSAHLFLHDEINNNLLLFVFFSTICSYNFHWYLTVHSATGSERLQWAVKHKSLHFILYLLGAVGAIFYFFTLRQHWGWIGIGAFVTFLYSAPKIPHPLFRQLKQVAIGKTIFLAFVWMYITSILPFLISGQPWQAAFSRFACSRFFLIYAICILFDYRDREDDKADGIRSMITYLDEKGINILFFLSIAAFIVFTLLLNHVIGLPGIIVLLVPGIITALLYNYARKHFSDYFYYFVLDGLMMLSALLMLVLQI